MTLEIEPAFEADFTFATDEPFALSGGESLQPVTLRYAVYGHLSPGADNVVLVCHALSGSARVADWWPKLFGPGRPLDLDRVCVLGVNMLGSCYGSTGPTSLNLATGSPYGPDFPSVSIADNVRAQARLLDHLGIARLHTVLGGSIGGMQAMTWATDYPHRVARCISVGAAPLSALGLALGHLQRLAIFQDPAFEGGRYGLQPARGLALARALAMCSYKSPELFDERYGRKPDRNEPDAPGRFDVAGYLDYQGRIFVDRFDANSYIAITRAMDTFDLGATPAEEAQRLAGIRCPVLLVGISSDWLFPAADVRSLAARMARAGVAVQYAELDSAHGHDAFLAEAADLIPFMQPILGEGSLTPVGRTMIPEITPQELQAALRAGQPVHLLDVRQPAEHALAALPGSQLVPLHELPARHGEVRPAPGALLVVYCHHGVRSQHGGAFLRQQGFADVRSLAGGIDAWSRLVDPAVPRY